MRFQDRLLRRANPSGYSERDYTGAEYASGGFGDPRRGREGAEQGIIRRARQAHRDNGVVFACETVKQALLSEARFTFQALTDGHLFGDTSLSLLEHPWPNADSGELITRMGQDAAMGNSYMRKALPAGDGPAELVRMLPAQVTIVSEQLQDDLGRTWRRPAGYIEDRGPEFPQQFFTVGEVSHFSPLPDPDARWRGMSWLTPILRDVHSDNRLTEYKTFHLDNGAMPGLVVKYAVKLGNRTVDTLRKRIRARYGGPENAGNVLILDEGADLTVAGSTLQDLQFDAVSKAGERRVCAAAGPGLLTILGFEAGDVQHALRLLGDFWARPHWRMLCASLEHLIPGPASRPDVPVRLWYNTSEISALREGELARAQAFLVAAQGVASAVQAGMERVSAIAAASAYDLSLLVPDPNAPTPGMAGRVTETEHLGAGQGPGPGGPAGGPQPPTGGPAGGIAGRPPQAGRPQQLPGVRGPAVPNALPAAFAPMPAIPGGARGSNGTARRSADVDDGEDADR